MKNPLGPIAETPMKSIKIQIYADDATAVTHIALINAGHIVDKKQSLFTFKATRNGQIQ
jgi:hypothetical protein